MGFFRVGVVRFFIKVVEFNAFFDCVGNVEDAMSFVAMEVNESLDFILVKSFMFVGA